MKRTLVLLACVLPASLLNLSCGSSSAGGGTTGLKSRAFVSQDISAGNIIAGLDIVDASKDVLAAAAPISAGATPGLMVETPSRAQTLVFSRADTTLAFINNGAEAASGGVKLPGITESIVVSPDSSTAYVAVPTAPVVGQSPGAIEVINLANGTNVGEIPVPSVRFLAVGSSGDRLLGFSNDSDSVAVITPSNLGTADPVVTFVGGFDRPVNAFFSAGDSSAFVLNCGAECGGIQAGVQILDLTTNTLGSLLAACTSDAVPVCSGSTALVSGSTMYLAGIPFNTDGTPFAQPCTGETTQATSCGLLTIIDLSTMTVTSSGLVITDGFHDRMALGANGQLFIGAHDCTEIVGPIPPPQGVEVRGCLSIYNTQTGAVIIPPANGDVTAIEPIPNRTVVYLIQGGELQIYDTATDKLTTSPPQINIIGQAVDVKVVDF